MGGGSSPQARGTRLRARLPRPSMGIIPAGAGNSDYDESAGTEPGDHPRRRGELVQRELPVEIIQGSSPQARGTRRHLRHNTRNRGIIPAGAGNSSRRMTKVKRLRDHPRRRGELGHGFTGFRENEGSSPQARGTLDRHRISAVIDGIIPAGAGNSLGSHWVQHTLLWSKDSL